MIEIEKTISEFGYDPSNLSDGSNKSCLCSCDYCGDIVEKKYFKWVNARKITPKDSCSQQSCRLKKQEANNLVRIGVKHHSQTKEYKEKFKKTCLEKYGVENPFASKEVKEKIKVTNLKRYGVENPQQCSTVKQKTKKTMFENYGVEYPYQSEIILKKVQDKIEKNYGTRFYAKTDEFRARSAEENRLTPEEILDICTNKNCKPLFDLSEYSGCREVYPFECLEHNYVFKTQVFYLSHPIKNQCPKCKNNGTSLHEQQVYEYVTSLGVAPVLGDRKILKPKELDVYVPEKKFAIEYHGLYWHSEEYKDKKYHFEKFQMCKEKGITLFQIYEDEWRDQREICESMISNRLGLTSTKLFARKLEIVSSDCLSQRFDSFFKSNHLQGNVRYKHALGLVDAHGEIISAISLRKPFTKNDGKTIEIARLASKKNTVVAGGFSRLMKYVKLWAKENGYDNILTYSDNRYSQGKVYEKYGFKFVHRTVVGYDYTDARNRYPRFKFRARSGLSEKEIARKEGVRKIHNAANYRWELPLT